MEILDCGHAESPHDSFTTGYGIDKDGKKYCYDCCALQDKQAMINDKQITLYLTIENDAFKYDNFASSKVTNWPGNLTFNARVKKGKHNIARYRYDCWFSFNGYIWHGVQYGDNTQIVYCKQTKERSI